MCLLNLASLVGLIPSLAGNSFAGDSVSTGVPRDPEVVLSRQFDDGRKITVTRRYIPRTLLPELDQPSYPGGPRLAVERIGTLNVNLAPSDGTEHLLYSRFFIEHDKWQPGHLAVEVRLFNGGDLVLLELGQSFQLLFTKVSLGGAAKTVILPGQLWHKTVYRSAAIIEPIDLNRVKFRLTGELGDNTLGILIEDSTNPTPQDPVKRLHFKLKDYEKWEGFVQTDPPAQAATRPTTRPKE